MKDRPSLAKYKEILTTPLPQASLCFLINKNRQVLLAEKKRGFAKGKWNGVGGKKTDKDKNIEVTAMRETYEEVKVIPKSLELVATINFYFLNKPEWGQQVFVFIAKKWKGKPEESKEMSPKWFDIKEIPYEHMWEDGKHWLPIILKGIKINADFLYDENQQLLEHTILEI
ncbi:8-oxo-dGTP diphosphatase [Patescibacteria group bacterium]|nr:8-oxo-dGTP diphosphatase [Patescibacteria group bacterium]MBU2036178.1 8-oxo-dGTP diphosphatase [Patescibacteria group bacterium]